MWISQTWRNDFQIWKTGSNGVQHPSGALAASLRIFQFSHQSVTQQLNSRLFFDWLTVKFSKAFNLVITETALFSAHISSAYSYSLNYIIVIISVTDGHRSGGKHPWLRYLNNSPGQMSAHALEGCSPVCVVHGIWALFVFSWEKGDYGWSSNSWVELGEESTCHNGKLSKRKVVKRGSEGKIAEPQPTCR